MDEGAVRPVVRWRAGEVWEEPDELVAEEPLEIRVRGRAVSVTMRTPGHDEELAAGFLLTEGVIRDGRDIVRIEACGRNEFGNVMNVILGAEVAVDFEKLTRLVFAASSCGLCGKASIEAIRGKFAAVRDETRIEAGRILAMPGAMRAAQETFSRTGGLHAAGLFDAEGKLLVLREDVGRHNAVDKVIGWAVLGGRLPLSGCVLLVSGRSSFEIMQKALAARVPVVAAVSAPSALAADFAEESGQTLIGFLREERMNVYAHGERVDFGGIGGIGGIGGVMGSMGDGEMGAGQGVGL